MPIKIIKTCKHCGQAVEQDDYFTDWFHVGRADAPNDMPCDPAEPNGKQATPTIEVVALERKEDGDGQ